jgi:DNA replication protein DnaC
MDQEAWKRAKMFRRYWDVEYVPNDEGEQATLDLVREYMDEIPLRTGAGLLLVGPPGTGKTLLAHMVLAEAHDQQRGPVRAMTMAQFIDWHQQLMGLSRLLDEPEAAALYMRISRTLARVEKHYRYLLLDDVGKEYIGSTNWVQTQFNTLVRARGNAMLPTIITTNCATDELQLVYGEAMASYLMEVCRFIPVDGLDHRAAR